MLIRPATDDDVHDLAGVLVDAVRSGACVGFLANVTLDEAEAFWLSALMGGKTWVARLGADEPVAGVVQLLPAKLPNGSHRAEVAKLLVHRSGRRRGIAKELMRTVEQEALSQGRWLLQLDTETGSAAEMLYIRLGWQVLGVLPDHAVRPEGELAPTTFLFKRLRAAEPPGTRHVER